MGMDKMIGGLGARDLATTLPIRRDTIFRGWGFGLSVIARQDGVGPSPGSFGWDGGFNTSCYTDPREDMIAILLVQRLMNSPTPSDFYADFWTLAYQAIDD